MLHDVVLRHQQMSQPCHDAMQRFHCLVDVPLQKTWTMAWSLPGQHLQIAKTQLMERLQGPCHHVTYDC